MKRYWVTLKNEPWTFVLNVEKNQFGLHLLAGSVYNPISKENTDLTKLSDLEKYGYDYPYYIADIEEETHRQEMAKDALF